MAPGKAEGTAEGTAQRSARPVGIVLLVGAALASIGWSLNNLPEPTVTLAYADTGDPAAQAEGLTPPAPLDVLADAGFEARDGQLVPQGPGRAPGIYRVGDSPDRDVRDRDVKPRVPPYDDDQVFVEGNIAPVEQARPQGEIPPGLYATSFESSGCSYELTQVLKDREVAVIGEDQITAGRVLVHLNEIEPDWFSSSQGCGLWYNWSPLPVALTQAGNGDYWVGDLARGVWRVPDGCRWEKVVSFRGAALDDVVSYGAGPTPLVVDFETYGVRVRGCTAPLILDVEATEDWSADVDPGARGQGD
jgi:hypothetical protein